MIDMKALEVRTNEGNTLVRPFDFYLKKREIVGIFGESGSGKTISTQAMFNLLPRSLVSTAVEKVIEGKNLDTLLPREYRKLIGIDVGYIPQNTTEFLHPLVKIKHQMLEGFVTHQCGTKKEGLKRATELLTLVGLKNPKKVLNGYSFELSGGMRQRVNIALSLMTKPRIIILDEPTTALDSITEHEVMEFFKKLNQEEGVSLILITHNMKLIEKYTDRAYVFYKGEMVETNDTETLFKDPTHPHTKALVQVTREEDVR